jgi:hypothetical protein
MGSQTPVGTIRVVEPPLKTEEMLSSMKKSRLWRILSEVHHDQRGAVSLETILIIGAIALPILIFLIKVGWPRIKGSFVQGMDELDSEVRAAKQ